MNDSVRAAKILGACFIIGCSIIGAMGMGGLEIFIFLGLWLLVGPWTGRSIWERIQGLFDSLSGKVVVNNEPAPKPAPPATETPSPPSPADNLTERGL
jgi:hypothetical protein